MISRWSFLRHYLLARHGRRFRSRAELLRWQDRKAQQHVARVLTQSNFYRRRFGSLRPAEWLRSPLLDRATMMAHFDDLNTAGIPSAEALALALEAEASGSGEPCLGAVTVSLSEVASGPRGLFLTSAEERAAEAGLLLARVLPRGLFARERIAWFLAAGRDLAALTRPGLFWELFDPAAPLEGHLQRLNRLQPTLLVAPPTWLRQLAEAQRDQSLTLHPFKVVAACEAMNPLDGALIRSQFGSPLHQLYLASEGFLGSTCAHGTLHLNEDRFAIQREYLDEDRRKFLPILTDLVRTIQPILRYRLDDVLTERATPCPCGSVFTALESVEPAQAPPPEA